MRTIKTTTLQKRFDKLHTAANYAEDCARAIVFHADRLSALDQTAEQAGACMKLTDDVENWCESLARLASEMQNVENEYLNHLKNNNTECELIEEVPSFSKSGAEIPDLFTVEAKLFEIGFYELEGDSYSVSDQDFDKDTICTDIGIIRTYMNLFVKALAAAEYKGIWQHVGELVNNINDSTPDDDIANLLGVYGLK